MKKMNIKKAVLKISFAYFVYSLLLLLLSYFCHGDWCDIREDGPFGLILFSFAPLLPIFLFSLITYKMRDHVFHAWWNFARWWIPVIIVVTLLLNNASDGGGGMGGGGLASGMLDFAVLWTLYIILVVVSLFKIIWEYFGMLDRKKHHTKK